VVRIPIDRAMELLAQRGLPVISQADAARAGGENASGEHKPMTSQPPNLKKGKQ